MNISSLPIISTALCLIICWALFAIFCSFIHEAVAQVKAERGRFMKKYLFQQLQDLPNGVNWASLIYLNGSVDLLSRTAEKPTNEIPPDLFSRAFVEVLGSAHLVQMHKEGVPETDRYKNTLLDNFKVATLVLRPSDVASFLKQALHDAELKGNIGGVPDEGLIYQHLLTNIADWFSSFNGRVSYWYKKKTKQRLFLLGILLAALLNVDSIRLFNYYNNDPVQKAALISYYNKEQKQLSAIADSIDTMNSAGNVSQNSLKNTSIALKSQFDTLTTATSIPIGWPKGIFPKIEGQPIYKSIFWSLLGILISAFAASFGAPFWFQVIQKIYTPTK